MLDKIMEQLGGEVAEQIAGKAGVSLNQAKGFGISNRLCRYQRNRRSGLRRQQ